MLYADPVLHQHFIGLTDLVEGSTQVSNISDVFLLVENRLLREALTRFLSRENDIRIVGTSPYSPAIDREIISAHPHIVLLDCRGFSLSNATVIAPLRAANDNLRFVLVDMDPDETTFMEAVSVGVVGYMLKDASASEIVSTIRSVMVGGAACPASLSIVLFRFIAQQRSAQLEHRRTTSEPEAA